MRYTVLSTALPLSGLDETEVSSGTAASLSVACWACPSLAERKVDKEKIEGTEEVTDAKRAAGETTGTFKHE